MIQDFCEVDLWQDELPPSREELLKRVRGVDGLLSLLTDKIDGEVMDAAGKQLKVISNHAVGSTTSMCKPRPSEKSRLAIRRMCSPMQLLILLSH